MSFLTDYLEYCRITEAPEIYDQFSGLSTISSLVSRRVWLNLGHFRCYPNLYIILVGGAGGRKTTAMDVSLDFVRSMKEIPFAGTCMTKEAVCMDMMKNCTRTFEWEGQLKEYTHYTMCLTEFSHFIAVNPAHMIDFLVTIYDREIYETKTKNKGDDIIPGPYVTMLACTTPNNILRYLKEDIISGGFSRRALFVFSNDSGDPKAIPEVTTAAEAAMGKAKEYAKELLKVKGPFVWSDEALSFYKDWYDKLFYSLATHSDPTTIGYYRSKHMQLLKIAMLLSLSESTKLVLEKAHIQAGLALLGTIESRFHKVFEGIGRNVLNSVRIKVLELLDQASCPLPEKHLKRILSCDANSFELKEVLDNLIDTEAIVTLEQKQKETGLLLRKWFAIPEVGVTWSKKSGSEFDELYQKLKARKLGEA